MLTSKRASLSYSVTTWASLRSSAFLMLHTASLLFLQYRTPALKGLRLTPSAAQNLNPPSHSTKAEASLLNPFPHYIFAFQERTTTFSPSMRYKDTIFTEIVFRKKDQGPYGHMITYSDCPIENHFVALWECWSSCTATSAAKTTVFPSPCQPGFMVRSLIWMNNQIALGVSILCYHTQLYKSNGKIDVI